MAPLGFRLDENYRFRLDNRLFRVNPDGAKTLEILTEIYLASISPDRSCWTLRMRDRIRQIELLNNRAVLTHVIEKTPDARLRILAIWLRGRCGGYIGTSIVAKHAHSSDFETQKESVRALKRMSGWSHLREIADSSVNSRLRIMATQHPGRPLEDRLANVLTNINPVPTSGRRTDFWMLPGLRLTFTPPKTLKMIQRILKRIHSLVSDTNKG